MGFSTGGLIVKNAARLSDKDLLAAVNRNTYSRTATVGLSEASSANFRDGTAIARAGDLAILFDKDMPHSSSFEEDDLSKQDQRFAGLSAGGDLLCFLINDNSDTYAYSVFQNGRRVRAMSTAGGMDISDFGTAAGYESDRPKGVANMMGTIDKFIGRSFVEWTATNDVQATAYYK